MANSCNLLNVLMFIAFYGVHVACDAQVFGRSEIVSDRKELCRSKQCEERAGILLDYIDNTSDPCHDFYSYACGIFLKPYEGRPIPLDPLTRMKIKVDSDLEDICRRLPEPTEALSAVDKAAMTYQVCMHSRLYEELEIEAVKKVLARNGFEMWPLLGNSTSRRHFQGLEDVLLQTGLCSLFECDIGVDVEYPKQDALWLKHRTTLDRSLEPCIEGHLSIMNSGRYAALVVAAAQTLRPDQTEGDYYKCGDAVASLQMTLQKMDQAPVSDLYRSNTDVKMTIEDMQRILSGFPVLKILNRQFRLWNTSFNETDYLVLDRVDYFNRTLRLLMDQDPDVVFNMIGARQALRFLQYSSKDYQIAHAAVCGSVYWTRRKICTNVLRRIAPHIVSRWYGNTSLGDSARAKARRLLNYIGETYYERLKFTPWMDSVTKKRALDKLRKMVPLVGYPDEFMNDTFLDSIYDSVGEVRRNESLSTIVQRFEDNAMRLALSRLGPSKKLPRQYQLDFTLPNGLYLSHYNTFVILAGMLQGNFFQEDLPWSVNLGAIGIIMGHEITHGFYDQGSKLDGEGNRVNWWTNYTRSKFDEKANCFVKQYGSLLDPSTNTSVDGQLTLDENIADNGGARVAYHTHLKLMEGRPHVVLPGLENFTSDQIFFLSYAAASCEEEERYFGGDPQGPRGVHAPRRHRVNVPFRNMEEFSAAFRCPKGSAMRLTGDERCVLW